MVEGRALIRHLKMKPRPFYGGTFRECFNEDMVLRVTLKLTQELDPANITHIDVQTGKLKCGLLALIHSLIL